jgi:hypothetical protein
MSEPFWTRWHFNIFVVLSAVDVQAFCTDQDQVKDIEPDVEPDQDSLVLFFKIDRRDFVIGVRIIVLLHETIGIYVIPICSYYCTVYADPDQHVSQRRVGCCRVLKSAETTTTK